MTRRHGFVSGVAAMQRAAERSARARVRIAREYERRHRQEVRVRLANHREQIRLFHESQQEEVASRNQDLAENIQQLKGILDASLGMDHRLSFEKLKSHFSAGDPPRPEVYLPKPLGFFRRIIPGATVRQNSAIREARQRFDGDVAAYPPSRLSRTSFSERFNARCRDTPGLGFLSRPTISKFR
jgi:hypothetical protein